MQAIKTRLLHVVIAIMISTFFLCNTGLAQSNQQYARIVNLIIEPSKIDSFKAALKEDIEAALSKESGVLNLYAVYEKDDPTHVTVFEIYANEEAHQSHMQTPHLKKYKDATKNMVQSIVRKEVILFTPAMSVQPKNIGADNQLLKAFETGDVSKLDIIIRP